MYFDKDCHPISFFEYSELACNDRYCLIGRYRCVRTGTMVSTVWLGSNHGRGGDPLIFETRIFGGDHAETQWLYSTLEDARRGHVACVTDIKLNRQPWWVRGETLNRLPILDRDAILRDELEE